MQEVFANKIKQVQACTDTHGRHFQHLFISAQQLSERTVDIAQTDVVVLGNTHNYTLM
jgi:hypothetical protein